MMFQNLTNFQNKTANKTRHQPLLNQKLQLEQLEQSNKRLSYENSSILERVKMKWKSGLELKRRLKYLQALSTALKEGEETQSKQKGQFKKQKSEKYLECVESVLAADELESLQERFQFLVIEGGKENGLSKAKVRAEMTQVAKKIKSIKASKVNA